MPGPPPKPREKRARTNAEPIPIRTLELVRQPAPRLPVLKDSDGNTIPWHPQTRAWWKVWTESVLSQDFTAADWSFLTDTAVMHNRFWNGDLSWAAELRLRVAKFGATPEDRARLRIVFADAEHKEKPKAAPAGSDAKNRYGQGRSATS